MVYEFVNKSKLFIIILFCFLIIAVYINLLSIVPPIHASYLIKDNLFKEHDNINFLNKFYIPIEYNISIGENKLKLSDIMSNRINNPQSYIPLNHNYLSSDPLNVYIISNQDDQ